jgi:hypothetical protein
MLNEGPITKICQRCGTQFTCGTVDGNSCWCNSFPPIFRPDADSTCMCNACLHQAMKQTIEAYVKDIFPEQALKLDLRKYQTKKNIEGIDYYIENGSYVFTKWYHLKRGECCKNGCRHCPYGFKKNIL